ncbi:MAG: ATP-binding cassette domain-containing protein, partial [Syntrophomonadaceae bacterium]|nr:ATP-binding cassette domain-containing protein [Syntrophomonadaceae bacterium]
VFGTRGVGKTILLHTLAGITRYKSGQVEVLGCDPRKTEAFKRCLGVVTQEPSLFRDLRVIENLDFIATLKKARRSDIIRVIDQFELAAFLQQSLDSLEAGIYQRLALACAMVNSPKVLIIDDLLDGIDLYSQQLMQREVQAFVDSGGTCVWGFSQVEQCSLLHRVGWLENGQLTIMDPQILVIKWQQQLETRPWAGDRLSVLAVLVHRLPGIFIYVAG